MLLPRALSLDCRVEGLRCFRFAVVEPLQSKQHSQISPKNRQPQKFALRHGKPSEGFMAEFARPFWLPAYNGSFGNFTCRAFKIVAPCRLCLARSREWGMDYGDYY